MLDHQPGADEVDAQDAGEIFDCVVEDTFHAAGDTRIGKGDVEMAMQCDGLCDNRRDVRFIACVHLHGSGGVTDHCGGVMHRCRHVA